MRLRPIRSSVYFRFSIYLLHAPPNADSHKRYSDCDDNDSNHGITARPFIPCHNYLRAAPATAMLSLRYRFRNSTGAGPANAAYFVRAAAFSGVSSIFIGSRGLLPIVNTWARRNRDGNLFALSVPAFLFFQDFRHARRVVFDNSRQQFFALITPIL